MGTAGGRDECRLVYVALFFCFLALTHDTAHAATHVAGTVGTAEQVRHAVENGPADEAKSAEKKGVLGGRVGIQALLEEAAAARSETATSTGIIGADDVLIAYIVACIVVLVLSAVCIAITGLQYREIKKGIQKLEEASEDIQDYMKKTQEDTCAVYTSYAGSTNEALGDIIEFLDDESGSEERSDEQSTDRPRRPPVHMAVFQAGINLCLSMAEMGRSAEEECGEPDHISASRSQCTKLLELIDAQGDSGPQDPIHDTIQKMSSLSAGDSESAIPKERGTLGVLDLSERLREKVVKASEVIENNRAGTRDESFDSSTSRAAESRTELMAAAEKVREWLQDNDDTESDGMDDWEEVGGVDDNGLSGASRRLAGSWRLRRQKLARAGSDRDSDTELGAAEDSRGEAEGVLTLSAASEGLKKSVGDYMSEYNAHTRALEASGALKKAAVVNAAIPVLSVTAQQAIIAAGVVSTILIQGIVSVLAIPMAILKILVIWKEWRKLQKIKADVAEEERKLAMDGAYIKCDALRSMVTKYDAVHKDFAKNMEGLQDLVDAPVPVSMRTQTRSKLMKLKQRLKDTMASPRKRMGVASLAELHEHFASVCGSLVPSPQDQGYQLSGDSSTYERASAYLAAPQHAPILDIVGTYGGDGSRSGFFDASWKTMGYAGEPNAVLLAGGSWPFADYESFGEGLTVGVGFSESVNNNCATTFRTIAEREIPEDPEMGLGAEELTGPMPVLWVSKKVKLVSGRPSTVPLPVTQVFINTVSDYSAGMYSDEITGSMSPEEQEELHESSGVFRKVCVVTTRKFSDTMCEFFDANKCSYRGFERFERKAKVILMSTNLGAPIVAAALCTGEICSVVDGTGTPREASLESLKKGGFFTVQNQMRTWASAPITLHIQKSAMMAPLPSCEWQVLRAFETSEGARRGPYSLVCRPAAGAPAGAPDSATEHTGIE